MGNTRADLFDNSSWTPFIQGGSIHSFLDVTKSLARNPPRHEFVWIHPELDPLLPSCFAEPRFAPRFWKGHVSEFPDMGVGGMECLRTIKKACQATMMKMINNKMIISSQPTSQPASQTTYQPTNRPTDQPPTSPTSPTSPALRYAASPAR